MATHAPSQPDLPARRPWRFLVDRGGTFTDVVALSPDGRLLTAKLLSQDPGRYEDAAIEAMHRITGTPPGDALPAAELRLGTTVATNALLERKGEPVLLAITAGFADALTIGTQDRPDIFARAIRLPEPLHADVIEIAERVTADGEVLVPLDEDAARMALRAGRERGFAAVAIVLMHGWRAPAHEAALARIAREEGFAQVSVSHEVARVMRLIPRGLTTVADAYLSPVLARYVVGLEAGLGPDVGALYMRSGGTLAPGSAFTGRDAVLSGPAGGILGLAAAAKGGGLGEVVGFDMGGTSTDVSWYGGSFEREEEARVAGVRLAVPMMRIATVAAGGGSICRFERGRFRVGPESAGAVPGPACYRRGGPLTVTDCNLVLGRLQAEHFPPVFGPGGDEPLDRRAALGGLDAVIAEAAASGHVLTREAAAEGFLAIAVAEMARAIKAVTLRRGHDVARATLVPFGGAGGQHACAVAEALGMDSVLCHPLASLLSAWGMGLAERGVLRAATVALPLETARWDEIATAIARLGDEAESDLAAQNLAGPFARRVTLSIRPAASDNAVELAFPPQDAAATAGDSGASQAADPVAALEQGFAAGWAARFGYAASGPLVVEAVRVEVVAPGGPADARFPLPETCAPPQGEVALFADGCEHRAPLWRRKDLGAGFVAAGPALIVDDISSIFVAPGWRARIDADANCLLTRAASPLPVSPSRAETSAPDPVRIEIMGALFMAVAEEMGAALQFSAASINIRERLDFSCALFDAAGNLVANAPHMPVHLGSMGESVRAILAARGARQGATPRAGAPLDGRGIRPGDAYALNAPYAGGTHLPDITVVMPVFATGESARPAWFVAARGHHADVGGISPGSMPPNSTSLAEEGVVLDNLLIVEGGRLREAKILAALGAGPWPARNPAQNLADLSAQLAACARGAAELQRIATEQGRAVVDAYMGHLQEHSEAVVRQLLNRLADGAFVAPLDNGATIAVRLSIERAGSERPGIQRDRSVALGATIDFTGTSPQLVGNFNAPLGVTRAAVLYVLRCLIDEVVPMNEGFLRPIRLIVPEGSMLSPDAGAAVVAGNVETSQVLCDALFAAMDAMAASQGTMNNLTFGDARRQYYETIAGGAGAGGAGAGRAGAGVPADGAGFAGASAVQTHMTNSRLTDPEVLEAKFPVRLESFAIRRGSGGTGRWPGGDGVVRRLRFLEPMRAGILANRRTTRPFGLAGGGDGAPGVSRVLRADGSVEVLPASASLEMAAGDALEVLTPGGGGYGEG